MNDPGLELIETIMCAAENFETTEGIRPTVFMTRDLIYFLKESPALQCDTYFKGDFLSVAGYELKEIRGENELYVGGMVSVPFLRNKSELKPCPLCGSEAAFIGGFASIKCKRCDCSLIVTNPLMSRKEAAQAWNRREDDGR